jgi:lipopolysaccharide transport system ATP-binding protein
MSDVVIRVEQLSKQYQLGQVDTGTLIQDVNRWWARLRGQPDPYLRVGDVNDRTLRGDSDFVWALRDINFEVRRGEVLGIIGRNGAGKSTLLKILSRVTSPTTGQVMMKGRVGSLLEVGTGFHPELTGRENIFLNGAILGMTKAEVAAKLDDIIEFSGCLRYIDTPVKRYSSGMYVRLAFAVAAHLEPEILIVDEVLAVGDLEFQAKCLGRMRDVAGHDRTVLFVSHNMAAIKVLCPNAMLLHNGTIHAVGPSADVVEEYRALSVQGAGNRDRAGQVGDLYRADAPPAGEFAVTAVQLLDRAGQPRGQVATWEYARLRVHYTAPEPVVNASVWLTIATEDDQPILLMSTQPDCAVPVSFARGQGYVDCCIDAVPLPEGRYWLGAGLAVPRQHALFKELHLCMLHVQAADVFQSGAPPASSRMLAVVPHTWEVPDRVD